MKLVSIARAAATISVAVCRWVNESIVVRLV